MKRILSTSLSVAILCAPLTTQAAEFRTIQSGESYYLDKLFENKLVKVLGKENGKIKIQYEDGAVDWVSPSHLLTRSESAVNDGAEIGAAAVLTLGALICIFDNEACKNLGSNSNKPKTSKTPQQSSHITVQVVNEYCKPIDYYVDDKKVIASLPGGSQKSIRLSSGSKTGQTCLAGTHDCLEPERFHTSSTITVTATSSCLPPTPHPSWLTNTLLDGEWHYATPEEVKTLTPKFSSMAPRSYRTVFQSMTKLRARTLPFYKDATLLEGEVEGESEQPGVLSFLLHRKGMTILDGTSNPIHRVNAWMPLDLSTQEKAQNYLQFFTAAISGEEGNFRIVQSPAQIEWDVQADESSKQSVHVQALTVYPTDGLSWQATGTVQYGKNLYAANFMINSQGKVQMEDDTLMMAQLPISQNRYVEGVRYRGF